MRAIYKREFQSYFRSMTGNVFVALLVVFTGIYFMAYNLNMGYPYFSYSLAGSLMVYLVAIPDPDHAELLRGTKKQDRSVTSDGTGQSV